MTIIFQHMLRQGLLYFLNNTIVEFQYFILIFIQNLQLFMFTGLYNLVTTNHAVKDQHTIMHLPFVNLGAKFQPDRVDAHPVETLCLQHILARLWLILCKLRLSRFSALPC